MTTMRGKRRFSILLGVGMLAALPSCQRYITVAGRAEGFDQGGKVLVIVPNDTVPSMEHHAQCWRAKSLGHYVELDDSGRFHARFRLAGPASIQVVCGDGKISPLVWGGDSVYVEFRNSDSFPCNSEITRVKFAGQIADRPSSYRGQKDRWLSTATRERIGMRAALDSLTAFRRSMVRQYRRELKAAGVPWCRRGAYVRSFERLATYGLFWPTWFGVRGKEGQMLIQWNKKHIYGLGSCNDRRFDKYCDYQERRGRELAVQGGLLDTVAGKAYKTPILRYPEECHYCAMVRSTMDVLDHVEYATSDAGRAQDTVQLPQLLQMRQAQGEHTRLDSLALAAWRNYKAGLERGYGPRVFHPGQPTLDSLVAPVEGEKLRGVLVWCWLANSREAAQQVGALAEIEHQLAQQDVRSVHVCFDNGDYNLRSELYLHGLQGEYWRSNRALRTQLLQMLGIDKLHTPRLLLLSSDGRLLDAALPDASDVEGVVKRVGKRL